METKYKVTINGATEYKNATDRVQYIVNNKGTGMTKTCEQLVELEVDYVTEIELPDNWEYIDRHIRISCAIDLLSEAKYQAFFERLLALKVPYTVEEITEVDTYYLKELRKSDGFSIVNEVIETKDNNLTVEQFGTFTETAQKIIQVE